MSDDKDIDRWGGDSDAWKKDISPGEGYQDSFQKGGGLPKEDRPNVIISMYIPFSIEDFMDMKRLNCYNGYKSDINLILETFVFQCSDLTISLSKDNSLTEIIEIKTTNRIKDALSKIYLGEPELGVNHVTRRFLTRSIGDSIG